MAGGFDDAELRAYAATLTDAAAAALDQVRPVIARGAQLVAEMAASPHFGAIAGSISYDTTADPSGVVAEIGPNTARAGGALANIAYFGSPSKPGGATVPDPMYAAEAEYPTLERYLADIMADPL
jgi:hypothetical protein